MLFRLVALTLSQLPSAVAPGRFPSSFLLQQQEHAFRDEHDEVFRRFRAGEFSRSLPQDIFRALHALLNLMDLRFGTRTHRLDALPRDLISTARQILRLRTKLVQRPPGVGQGLVQLPRHGPRSFDLVRRKGFRLGHGGSLPVMNGELVCGVCRLKVNFVQEPGGSIRYLHAGALDYAHLVGHPPEPVIMPNGNAIYQCDFCSERKPAWVIPLQERRELTVRVQASGFELTSEDDGWWTACDVCAELIRKRKIRLLRERSLARLREITGGELEPEVAEMIRLKQASFWLAKPGDPLPVELFRK